MQNERLPPAFSLFIFHCSLLFVLEVLTLMSITCFFQPFIENIYRQHGLTEQEKKIANLIVLEGLDNQEISERIFRALITVKKSAAQIYRKFGVHKRTELMAFFIRKLCAMQSYESTKCQSSALKEAV